MTADCAQNSPAGSLASHSAKHSAPVFIGNAVGRSVKENM